MPFYERRHELYSLAALGLEANLDMLEDAQFPQGCFYVFQQMLQIQVPSMSS